MNLRDAMAEDLKHLIGQLPVMCGLSAAAQTIPCAWLTQRDEVKFASPGKLRADSVQIIAQASSFDPPLVEQQVLWVSGHRYRVSLIEKIDLISLRIILYRSDK